MSKSASDKGAFFMAIKNNLFLYLTSVLLWGMTWYAIKFQLGIVHPTVSVTYRFVLAAIFLYIFCYFTGRTKHKFTKKQHAFIALQGFMLFCFNYWLTYESTAYLTSGLVAVCFSTMTIMNIIFQSLFFRTAVNKNIMIGAALGLLGIALIFAPEVKNLDLEDDTFKGVLLCLAGTMAASLGNMASFRNTRSHMPVILTSTYGMMYGSLFSCLIAIGIGAEFTLDYSTGYIASLLFLSLFGSAVAFACYLSLVANIGADKAGYAAVLIPIVALIISTIFEGYVWSLIALIGVILTLLGNIIAIQCGNPLRHLKLPRGWSLFKRTKR